MVGKAQQRLRVQLQNKQSLLQPRARTELELGCSKATAIRLEQDGKLKPMKLQKMAACFIASRMCKR
ncbi:MAG: hypothetical protein J0H89_12335 [Rhizobiales bacterium]|jgi:hypothetical protein|nr:hypothetical protein [Hyphomicrobiales bacterium]